MSEHLDTYRGATADQEQLASRLAYLAEVRASALYRLHESGLSYGQIASEVGLSRSKVQQLVERGRELAG